MKNRRRSWLLLINVLLIGVLFLSGCGGEEEEKPTPASPTGYSDDRFGFAWASSFYQPVLDTGKVNLAREAGATWDRWDFRWGLIENSPGVYEFDYAEIPQSEGPPLRMNYAGAVDHDNSAGLQIVGILQGSWSPHAGYGIDEWRAYVEATVARFGNDVDAWEIGNEYGLPLDVDSGMTPELYQEVVAATCEVLTGNGQSGKPILLGAPDDVAAIGTAALEAGISGDYDDPKGYIEQYRTILSIMGKNAYCVNGISVHAYGRPELSYWSAYWIYQRALNYGWSPDTGVWLTETGLPNVEIESGGWSAPRDRLSPSAYIVQSYALSVKAFGDLGIDELNPHKAMIFHHDLSSKEWGIMDPDRTSFYPAHEATQMMTELLAGASYVGDESDDTDDTDTASGSYRHLMFKNRDGQFVHVLWADTKPNICSGSTVRVEVTPKTTGTGCATLYYQEDYPHASTYEDTDRGRFASPQPIFTQASGLFELNLPCSQEGTGYRSGTKSRIPLIRS